MQTKAAFVHGIQMHTEAMTFHNNTATLFVFQSTKLFVCFSYNNTN